MGFDGDSNTSRYKGNTSGRKFRVSLSDDTLFDYDVQSVNHGISHGVRRIRFLDARKDLEDDLWICVMDIVDRWEDLHSEAMPLVSARAFLECQRQVTYAVASGYGDWIGLPLEFSANAAPG